jgi:hypothetical protein
MSCFRPQKYDDLTYAPSYGSVEVRGDGRSWSVDVCVEQGRAMEADGIPVYWIYATIPASLVVFGQMTVWLFLYRLFTWPGRFFR